MNDGLVLTSTETLNTLLLPLLYSHLVVGVAITRGHSLMTKINRRQVIPWLIPLFFLGGVTWEGPSESVKKRKDEKRRDDYKDAESRAENSTSVSSTNPESDSSS